MRERIFASTVYGLLLIGCNGSTQQSDRETENSSAPKVTPSRKIDFVHPTTPDELAKTLAAAFDAGDKESLDRLMLWGEATEEQKQKSAARVFFADRAGEYHVLETKVLPPDHEEVSKVHDGSGQSFALPLTEVLNVKYGNESTRITHSFRIGEKDGKYYIVPGY